VALRVMILAGEASGDLHGAGVVAELKKLSPGCDLYGIGGDKMQAKGMELVFHIRELAVMGFLEVIEHLPLLRSVEKTMTALLKARRPDVVLLVDYPGFNLRFAKFAREAGVKVVYYISPQVWAWNSGRVKKMRKLIDMMLVVFPFELEIYRKQGIPVEFVGHPLLDVLQEPQDRKSFCKRYGLKEERPILGLFPGSRRQELERIFPAMLGAARILQHGLGVQVAVGVSPALDSEVVRSFVRGDFPVELIQNAAHDLMKNSDVALVTSGTATLETGFYQTPMVVVYRTSLVSYIIGRVLVRIKMIGLVNIVAGEKLVPELIQRKATPENMAAEAWKMLKDEGLRKDLSQKLSVVRQRLGTPGASRRVAEKIVAMA
jgi:lipid-A-disaccharide synthase